MNDIDRSVEAFDFALRRRFKWIEVKAEDVMSDVLLGMGKIDSSKIDEAVKRINYMNEVISGEEGKKFRLSRAFHVGPSYFKELKFENDAFNWKEVFENEIESILREYVRSYDTAKQDDFITKCKKALTNSADGVETRNL